jgi:hypothetical protein
MLQLFQGSKIAASAAYSFLAFSALHIPFKIQAVSGLMP